MPTLSQALVPAPPPRATPERRRISVADRVARSFPPLACVRGFRYFARRRVDLVSVSETAIESDVKGKRTLHVILRIVEGRLSSACTCAPRMLGPAACRHVWATLLEIDRRGAFERLRTTERSLTLGVIETKEAPAAPATPTGRAKRARGAARGAP
ncbi:MAG TPA: hypothetical protein VLT33_23115 [Labilithrix sp.]|nr:hypothetical protein [Labilithrix sp.]